MANTAQARKRARQAINNRERNVAQRSHMRTMIKKVLTAIHAGNATDAQNALQEAMSPLDRAARKGLVHKNKAARLKSRLSAKVKAIA